MLPSSCNIVHVELVAQELSCHVRYMCPPGALEARGGAGGRVSLMHFYTVSTFALLLAQTKASLMPFCMSNLMHMPY
jgi:hypothetical protein